MKKQFFIVMLLGAAVPAQAQHKLDTTRWELIGENSHGNVYIDTHRITDGYAWFYNGPYRHQGGISSGRYIYSKTLFHFQCDLQRSAMVENSWFDARTNQMIDSSSMRDYGELHYETVIPETPMEMMFNRVCSPH